MGSTPTHAPICTQHKTCAAKRAAGRKALRNLRPQEHAFSRRCPPAPTQAPSRGREPRSPSATR
eukprot:9317846-Lingulodinium_polyedra.AAC.1